MNLDFGILWIEDSYSDEEETSLKRRILDAGFIARIVTIPNGESIENVAQENRLFHRYELILLDYKLEDENGDELAPKVRGLFPSTTILFYSGNYQEKKLRQMIADKKVEGVYCSHRSRFVDRAAALIEQTAHTLNRLSGMRGLAMRVVAECDDLMKSAVLAMSDRHDDCAGAISKLDEDVLEFLDREIMKYKQSTGGSLNDRIDTRAIDNAKLFRHFRRLIKVVTNKPLEFGLNQDQVDRLRELRQDSAQYQENVINKRNILGHVIEIEDETGWTLQGSSDISIDDFPEIRQTFAVHFDAFREMTQIVQNLGVEKPD